MLQQVNPIKQETETKSNSLTLWENLSENFFCGKTISPIVFEQQQSFNKALHKTKDTGRICNL